LPTRRIGAEAIGAEAVARGREASLRHCSATAPRPRATPRPRSVTPISPTTARRLSVHSPARSAAFSTARRRAAPRAQGVVEVLHDALLASLLAVPVGDRAAAWRPRAPPPAQPEGWDPPAVPW
jgi:hypothetical protein